MPRHNTSNNYVGGQLIPLSAPPPAICVGDVVMLAGTGSDTKSFLNAADGLLKRGDKGVVILVHEGEAGEPQPIRVRAFSGETFW